MKKTMFKRFLAALLAVVTLLSLSACGGKSDIDNEEKDDLSWLNTDGSLPLVKEGTEKTLKIAVRMQT